MALTCTTFGDFAEVASWYERIKPLRGKHNAGKDIRPIGDRKRKHERIVKIDDNCYALSDGYHFGDKEFGCYCYGATYTPTIKDMERYAPIVWRKHKDGTETVTLRNGTGQNYHTTRYAFLYRHTPVRMWFRNRSGRHFIEVGGQDYFLAKGTTVPRAVAKELKTRYRGRSDLRGAEEDNASLVFRRAEDDWVLVSHNGVAPTPPRKRVDKETKKQLKPYIDAFRDWVLTMAPLMPGSRDWEYRRRMHSEWTEWCVVNGYEGRIAPDVEVKINRQIVKQEDHPMRLYIAYTLKHRAELGDIEDEDDLRRAKQRLNNHLNSMLGLVNLVEE